MNRLILVIVILHYGYQLECQNRVIPALSVLMQVRDLDYLEIKNGFSPSLRLQFGKSSHLTSIKLQHIWWKTSETHMHRAQSSLIGDSIGRLILEGHLFRGINNIYLESLAAGIYLFSCTEVHENMQFIVE